MYSCSFATYNFLLIGDVCLRIVLYLYMQCQYAKWNRSERPLWASIYLPSLSSPLPSPPALPRLDPSHFSLLRSLSLSLSPILSILYGRHMYSFSCSCRRCVSVDDSITQFASWRRDRREEGERAFLDMIALKSAAFCCRLDGWIEWSNLNGSRLYSSYFSLRNIGN